MQVPAETRDVGSLRARVKGSYELPNVGAGA